MALSQAQILQTVRAVLSGKDAAGNKVTRNHLATVTQREIAWVAVAIMLARPDDYTCGGGSLLLQGHLRNALERIAVIGVPYPDDSMTSGDSLVVVCRKSGLSRQTDNRHGVYLTPPPELTALVAKLGQSPAVAAFCEDIEEAWRLRNLPRTWQVTGQSGSPRLQADRVIAWLNGLTPEVHAELVKRLPRK